MNRKIFFMVLIGLICLSTGALWAEEGSAPVKTSTLDNLQTAFNGESNANAKYLAFAARAKEEGYLGVEKLFLAAAKAEEIHAANHAKAIKRLGAEPKADLMAPEVKSTKENLEAALKGETYEKDVMYPDFIKQAQAEGNQQAVRTLRAAMLAEAEHAKFYTEALGNLDAWKEVKKSFIVCAECGYTTDDLAVAKCPVCSYPRSQFIEFK